MKAKKSPKNSPTPAERYVAFLQNAALQGIGLENAAIELDRQALMAAGDTVSRSLDAAFDVLVHTPDQLVIVAAFQLKHFSVDGGQEKVLLDIKCAFTALFNLGVACDAEVAKNFANTEAKLIFWPYLRHYISDTAFRMAINPILVPLLTVASTSASESDQAVSQASKKRKVGAKR